jgi:ABC-type oligopeptide transport system substrate-binding subunit
MEHTQLYVSQQKAAIANGDYQVAIDALCADTDDAGPLLLPYFSKEGSPRNMTRNSNPELDVLYGRLQARQQRARVSPRPRRMQRKVILDGNSVPVSWYSRSVAHV